ncbi:hypothetical protein B0H17DRAFT_1038066 [Mycena rosella]|uniref:Uncharacterized protein n=1 Tax=Mycena rosella TaxID=1033263 RepID=A0AAD7GUI0_MYCRO|nr:hypothetical protein B0H17DRAFT_1038066 [Mycena rosella]
MPQLCPRCLDVKLIVVAYTGTADTEWNQSTHILHPVTFTSAVYLDVPGLEYAVIHTGLTVAVLSLQRTGILMQLFVELFQHVMPLQPRGMWVTTLAAVLNRLVQSEKVLYDTHSWPPYRLQKQSLKQSSQHLAIARAIEERQTQALDISRRGV